MHLFSSRISLLSIIFIAACTGVIEGDPFDAQKHPPAQQSCSATSCGFDSFCDITSKTCVPVVSAALDARSEAEVCGHWLGRVPQQDLSQPVWMGDAKECKLGEFRDEAMTMSDTLRALNTYRWLSGAAPNVVEDSVHHQDAQACAVVMAANQDLSHFPPATFKCMKQLGPEAQRAARTSNLALDGWMSIQTTLSPVKLIDNLFADGGDNNAIVGHRRWFLDSQLTKTSIGFAANKTHLPQYNIDSYVATGCFSVFEVDENGYSTQPFVIPSNARAWMAYPNPGFAPLELAMNHYPERMRRWSFHSDTLNLDGAHVRVERAGDGVELALEQYKAEDGYGPSTLVFIPKGWEAKAAEPYKVLVTLHDGTVINYQVEFTTCGVTPADPSMPVSPT